MPTWVTHLIVADRVLERFPALDRRGFCVGNIAPDCNIENEDWTAFTPSREVTHWMGGHRKSTSDGERFYQEYIVNRSHEIKSNEQCSFLLGYWTHLITDAAFQRMIHDEQRVKAMWERIKQEKSLKSRAFGYPEDWDSAKRLLPKDERIKELNTIEAAYLKDHPDSGYITEIMTLKEFPDYIDYLPSGCIVRKIGVMGRVPKQERDIRRLIFVSEGEFYAFIKEAVDIATDQFEGTKAIHAYRQTSDCEGNIDEPENL